MTGDSGENKWVFTIWWPLLTKERPLSLSHIYILKTTFINVNVQFSLSLKITVLGFSCFLQVTVCTQDTEFQQVLTLGEYWRWLHPNSACSNVGNYQWRLHWMSAFTFFLCHYWKIKSIIIPVASGLPPVDSWKSLTSSYKLTYDMTINS